MQVAGEKAKRQNTSESEPCAVGVVEDVIRNKSKTCDIIVFIDNIECRDEVLISHPLQSKSVWLMITSSSKFDMPLGSSQS